MTVRGNGQETELRRITLKKALGILGLALVLAALLTVFVAGSLLAADDNAQGAQNYYHYEECPVMSRMVMISPIYGVHPAHMDWETLLRQTRSL